MARAFLERVSVARALAQDPHILLLDEPLSALDALTRATLQDEIERIWEQDQKTVVLITNDVDEGLLLADRIIPLSVGPGATLGPSFAIDLERPRNRKTMNQNPRYQEIRRHVLEYLLHQSARKHAAVTRKLVLPDIAPEDLSVPHSLFAGRTLPRRRSEIKEETVGMDL